MRGHADVGAAAGAETFPPMSDEQVRDGASSTPDVLSRMERDWDARAREAPEHYIATARQQWRMDEFFQSGEINVENDILADAGIIGRGKKPGRMRVLEIGCGAGRMTRAMAASFGEVHAVDISAEMIAAAKRNLSDLRNVFLYKNNGIDLAGIPDRSCDFAFSFIVFQHIPIPSVIETYVREVHRCLRPGAVFKFQVQGTTGIRSAQDDTWVGVPMSLADARALADGCGFELLGASGQGTQYFWLWFQKPKWPWIPKAIRSNAREALTRMRSAIERPVAVTFSPPSVRAGESYGVRVPGFAGQAIDIGYELTTGQSPAPVAGVVGRWCDLDSRGEASIPVPAEHPTGIVRITKVRSRTRASRWYRAEGAIPVEGRRA
jgi:ubiquinone/menaquinone biosynthesis C-methylase UbiE